MRIAMLNGKPFYTRLALIGVGMYLLIAAIIALAILIFEPSEILFPVIVALVASVVGAIIYFIHPWGLFAAVLGGLFGLLFSSDGAAINLGSPQSFFDFAFTLFTLIGAIFLLVGGIVGLLQHFQHRTTTDGSPAVRTGVMAVLGLVAVLSVLSVILTVAGIGGVSAADKEGATLLTSKKSDYDLDALRASSKGTTKIVVKNKDPYLHTFTVDELGIDVKINPSSEKVIELKTPAPGSYVFYCKIVGHRPDMEGTLTVD